MKRMKLAQCEMYRLNQWRPRTVPVLNSREKPDDGRVTPQAME